MRVIPPEPSSLIFIDSPLSLAFGPLRHPRPIPVNHVDHEQIEESPLLLGKEVLELSLERQLLVPYLILNVLDGLLHGFSLRL